MFPFCHSPIRARTTSCCPHVVVLFLCSSIVARGLLLKVITLILLSVVYESICCLCGDDSRVTHVGEAAPSVCTQGEEDGGKDYFESGGFG